MIFDTHAHYDDDRFSDDRNELLNSLMNKGVGNVVNISADLEGCKNTLNLTEKYSFIYGALGIHPDGIVELTDAKLQDIREKIIENAIYNGGKIVAVGEIGLDYYYPDPPKDLQKEWFEKQLDMALDVNLPINIHSREAAKDTYELMVKHHSEKVGGIVHCYSYSVEMAKNFLDMGFLFGIGGVLTFKNAKKLIDVVEYLPMDAIVLETDAPYLAPVPKRGERNDSSNLIYVAQKVAEIKDLSVEEVIETTCKNAKKVYNIS